MSTDLLNLDTWPAPAPEHDVLTAVHRRARSIRRRRATARCVPVVGSLAAVALALAVLPPAGPASHSLQMADSRRMADGSSRSSGDEEESYLGKLPPEVRAPAEDQLRALAPVVTTPLRDEDVPRTTLPNQDPPSTPPVQGTPWARVVDDPEADETPNRDDLDIRFGEVRYHRGSDLVHVRTGLTQLGGQSTNVMVQWHFDRGRHLVQLYLLAGKEARVDVNNEPCSTCIVELDPSGPVADVHVPRTVLARDVGETLERFEVTTYAVNEDGYFDTFSPTSAFSASGNDTAVGTQSWTIG